MRTTACGPKALPQAARVSLRGTLQLQLLLAVTPLTRPLPCWAQGYEAALLALRPPEYAAAHASAPDSPAAKRLVCHSRIRALSAMAVLRAGEDIPEWFAFKSVVEVLRAEWK